MISHGHRIGGKFSPTYITWRAMIQRCTDSKRHNYSYYGGRGITVCSRWRESFANFLEDMGERPPGLTLDRKKVNENYCKENCLWATPTQQILNRRAFHKQTYREERATSGAASSSRHAG